jgi:hypothetical protein
MPTLQATTPELLQEEVNRFVAAVHRRSECDQELLRRAEPRFHRSWPLLVRYGGTGISAALHNASSMGLAFLSPLRIEIGSVITVRLFSHDEDSPWVSAKVRHATPTPDGFLIGCEFRVDRPADHVDS